MKSNRKRDGARNVIKTSMASYYAVRAGEYERIYEKPERHADLRRLRSFVEMTLAGADVFEVACGTGYWTEILDGVAASIIATDINEEVLDIARSKRMTSKVTFRKEDAYALRPLVKRSTAGLAVFWWSHIPKSRLGDFLRGFHRVLCPGAAFYSEVLGWPGQRVGLLIVAADDPRLCPLNSRQLQRK